MALCVHVSFIRAWGPPTRQTHFMSRRQFFFVLVFELWVRKNGWKAVSSRPLQWSFYNCKRQIWHASYPLLFSHFWFRNFTNNFLSSVFFSFFFVYFALEIFILTKAVKQKIFYCAWCSIHTTYCETKKYHSKHVSMLRRILITYFAVVLIWSESNWVDLNRVESSVRIW